MQIFTLTPRFATCLAWVMFYSLGSQISPAQDAKETFNSNHVAAGQADVRPGQLSDLPPAESPRISLQPASLNARRPLPTGSNLLPSPAVFTRQPAVPEELMESTPNRRQPATTDSPNTMAAREPEPAACDDEKEVFRLTNQARAAAGLPALQWDEDLAKAARHHASDMEADGYFDHDTYDRINGRLVLICSAQKRMNLFSPLAAGENIAKGQPTADQVMQTWLASKPHRKGILRDDITSMGVGKARLHWVQNFGW